MQILTRLLCEDCGVDADIYECNMDGGCAGWDAHIAYLCKSCIEKRESEEE